MPRPEPYGESCLWCGRPGLRKDLNERGEWICACRAHLRELLAHVTRPRGQMAEEKSRVKEAEFLERDAKQAGHRAMMRTAKFGRQKGHK